MTAPSKRSCDYCPRFGVTTIYLRNDPIRVLLRLPRRRRFVCTDHLPRMKRPVGWRG